MNCLSDEQLARLALAFDADSRATAHADECPTCRQGLLAMQALAQRLSRAHERFDRDHGQQRDALLAALAAEDRAATSAPVRRRTIGTWLGGLTMRQKTALGGIGVAALMAAIVLWGANPGKLASAMEQMAESIRKAKSYEMTVDTEMQIEPKPGETTTIQSSGKIYWQSPRSFRMEFSRLQAGRDGQIIEIHPSDKPGIELDSAKKQFRRVAQRQGAIPPFVLLDRLGRFTGDADRKLGTREVDGHAARGFEIDARKIDPDSYCGPVEVWLDFDTNLPVRIRYKMEASTPSTLTMRDFRWNVEFDPKLFDTTPLAGYADATPKATPLEEQVRDITEALATYAELAGEYPQAKVVYGDVTRDEMYRMIGIQGGLPTPAQTSSKAYGKVVKAMKGFATLNVEVFRNNPDGAYHGLTVGPQDKGQVLVRWKLDDGRYQVIYGDLRAEIVTAGRLRELEDRK